MPILASFAAGAFENTKPAWERSRIITHGYVAGGYKDSSPWSNINRTVHSTDTTTNLGDVMTSPAAYCDGANGDRYFYVWGIIAAFMGSSADAWSWNMNTSASRGTNASWNMSVSRNDLGTMVDYEHAGAKTYIVGGANARTDRFNMITESMSTSSFPPDSGNGGTDYAATAEGKLRGWFKSASAAQSFAWATETYSSWTTAPATDGWGKAVSSYKGRFYMKNGGNLNSTLVKCNDDTGVHISSFAVQDAGEENYQMGNNKGYCLGHYNGQQNNNTYKVNYDADSYTTLGATAEPKGHAGMSSAALASAYVHNNASYGTSIPTF